jgi:hypothetical protein
LLSLFWFSYLPTDQPANQCPSNCARCTNDNLARAIHHLVAPSVKNIVGSEAILKGIKLGVKGYRFVSSQGIVSRIKDDFPINGR